MGLVKQQTMLAQEIEVRKEGKLLGMGHIGYDNDGQKYISEFISLEDGSALPDDWYDVSPTGREWLQVVPESVQ